MEMFLEPFLVGKKELLLVGKKEPYLETFSGLELVGKKGPYLELELEHMRVLTKEYRKVKEMVLNPLEHEMVL